MCPQATGKVQKSAGGPGFPGNLCMGAGVQETTEPRAAVGGHAGVRTGGAGAWSVAKVVPTTAGGGWVNQNVYCQGCPSGL